MKFAVSKIACRATASETSKVLSFLRDNLTVDAVVGSITVGIPVGVVPSRQIEILVGDSKKSFDCKLKWHRDSWIPVISRAHADGMDACGLGTYKEQKALVYSKEHYLKDSDVQKCPEEVARVTALDCDVVLIGMVGENRSPLAFTRNVASGHQEGTKENAEGAMKMSNLFIVED